MPLRACPQCGINRSKSHGRRKRIRTKDHVDYWYLICKPCNKSFPVTKEEWDNIENASPRYNAGKSIYPLSEYLCTACNDGVTFLTRILVNRRYPNYRCLKCHFSCGLGALTGEAPVKIKSRSLQASSRAIGMSGYRGVQKREDGRFAAAIKKDGRYYYIGRYASAESAAFAYNQRARELFGETAFQNQIEWSGRDPKKYNYGTRGSAQPSIGCEPGQTLI